MIEDKLRFNKKPKHKSKCLYDFNRYLNTFEKGNYMLFVKSYYKLDASKVKFYRHLPFTKSKIVAH